MKDKFNDMLEKTGMDKSETKKVEEDEVSDSKGHMTGWEFLSRSLSSIKKALIGIGIITFTGLIWYFIGPFSVAGFWTGLLIIYIIANRLITVPKTVVFEYDPSSMDGDLWGIPRGQFASMNKEGVASQRTVGGRPFYISTDVDFDNNEIQFPYTSELSLPDLWTREQAFTEMAEITQDIYEEYHTLLTVPQAIGYEKAADNIKNMIQLHDKVFTGERLDEDMTDFPDHEDLTELVDEEKIRGALQDGEG